MRKSLIVIVTVLLTWVGTTWATDIELGQVTLTRNQRKQLDTIEHSDIKGLQVREDGTVIAVTTLSALTAQTASDILTAIEALPDTDPDKDRKDRMDELAKKNKLTVDELVELLCKNSTITGDFCP